MDIALPLVIITVLILLNGLFVAAEFAIIGAPRAAIERRAAQGHPVAKLVNDTLRDPRLQDRYIATAQLGITFASLGLGMYGEHVLAGWIENGLERLAFFSATGRTITAHSLASVLAIATLTYFHIVIGEMVPKSMALLHAEKTVLSVSRPMQIVKTMFFPLVIALNGLGNGILALMGIKRELTAGHYHSGEELRLIIEESEDGGQLDAPSSRMLRDLLEFGERTAREVMVPRVRVAGLPLNASPDQMRAILRVHRHTRYPIYEADLDHIAGVIHIKDALRLLRLNQPLSAQDVRATAFVPETAPLDSVLEAMRRARAHLVVAMDEHGGTSGVVTIEDLCAEMVGDVEEGASGEGGKASSAPTRATDGRLRVAGTSRLDEAGEVMDFVLEHPEVDSVSGLILTLLERPPVIGDVVEYQGVRFEVTQTEGHGVEEALITPPLEVADDQDTF